MNEKVAAMLARARRSIEAARVLVGSGFAQEAVSRAYFAAFYAAEAALLSLGETRSKHAGVVSAFGELVVRKGGIDASVGKILSSLFERRGQADYGTSAVPPERAQAAIADAGRFAQAVEAWLEART